jgi:hypothetical protein
MPPINSRQSIPIETITNACATREQLGEAVAQSHLELLRLSEKEVQAITGNDLAALSDVESRLRDLRRKYDAASALARNDPTLLAKSDPAPPARGCRNSRSTRKGSWRVVRARSGSVVDRAFRRSVPYATAQCAGGTAGVGSLPR